MKIKPAARTNFRFFYSTYMVWIDLMTIVFLPGLQFCLSLGFSRLGTTDIKATGNLGFIIFLLCFRLNPVNSFDTRYCDVNRPPFQQKVSPWCQNGLRCLGF